MPYGDLSTVKGCIELYGSPNEQKLILKHGYPFPEMQPFDLYSALEHTAFACNDVAAETLLRELTNGEVFKEQREKSLIVINKVHTDLLEDCKYNPDSGKFGEVLYLLNKSLESLRTTKAGIGV